MPWKPLNSHFYFLVMLTLLSVAPTNHRSLKMPLQAPPSAPPQKQRNAKANNELAFKGILCVLIGLGVIVSPHFIRSPGMQGIVAQSAAVGWFALVLGLGFVGLYARRRFMD